MLSAISNRLGSALALCYDLQMRSCKGFAGRILVAFVAVVLLSPTVQGHNLWVTSQGDKIRVVFEHSPTPGQGAYNAEILRNGKTWVRTPGDAKASPISLSEVGQSGTRFLEGSTQTSGARVIEHSCLFGTYRGRLDFFYGKYLDIETAGQLEALGRAPEFPLDILPRLSEMILELKVLWQGELLQSYRFGVVTPTGKEISLQADTEGIVTFKPTEPGIYGFWVIRLDDGVAGEHQGEKYSGTIHGTTLSLPWPLQGETR